MLDHVTRIYDDITQTIGNTPLVNLKRFAADHQACANLLGKVEYFNPAGSIKDRPAMAMIDALMASDVFSDKTEIIEATSGNNGVACAWICAMRDIPITIVIPEHMSIERRKLIQLYGGKVVTTPKHLGTKGAIDKAKEMVAQRPHAVMLDQFANQANPNMHAVSTAQEIWQDTGGNVDVVVAGVGTGGTITGIAETLKRANADIEIVAVEPASCPVLTEGRAGTHKIQGLSSGHVPDILNTKALDRILTIDDDLAIHTARQLAKREGLPVGISSGAVAAAALVLAKQPEYAGKNIVCILADNAERYFSTELFADIG
ncbi:cysteine synthase A [Alteromonas sediminis]|uniref:Cysteine synthase n=1 Tax=Alteromonas sediminis TaxID=2259342 RepID=A0A3N5YEB7_9ALTE|nr:cysteine synthase A [Alteromonas sediminis]RPJ68025.1 cysteine synthase A [Alteromonas sediminis]